MMAHPENEPRRTGRSGKGRTGYGSARRVPPLSLRDELLLVIFALVFAMSGIVCVSAYFIFRRTITGEIGRARVDILKQVGERTRLVKNSLATISNLYYRDPDIRRAASDPSATASGRSGMIRALKDKADRYRIALNELGLDFYMVVVMERGFRYSSRGNESYDFGSARNNLWFDDVIRKRGEIHWVSSYEDFRNTASPLYVFSAARAIADPRTGEYLGLLLVNVRERILHATYGNVLTSRNTIYIADEKGSIVSHPEESMLGLNYVGMSRIRTIFGTGDYAIVRKAGSAILFSHYRDSESRWSIFEEIPLDDIIGPLKNVSLALAVIFVACIALSLALSAFFSGRITRPLSLFVDSMEKVGKGDLDVISTIHGWRELGDIDRTFNLMTVRLRGLVADIRQKESEKRKVELDFLRAQINPHFLYNTLFSIKCFISMDRRLEAEAMLANFIDLIRMTFSQGDELVSLDEELELVDKYVAIQKARYADSFHVRRDIGEGLGACAIPRLILQPIVENAIFHGMDPKGKSGSIRISAWRRDEDFFVSVKDDGPGMTEETIRRILSDERPAEGSSSMIALGNVRRRILLHFGEAYGMTIHSSPGEGTELILGFPMID
jgi:two-component system sensor histidine kinase YesM